MDDFKFALECTRFGECFWEFPEGGADIIVLDMKLVLWQCIKLITQ